MKLFCGFLGLAYKLVAFIRSEKVIGTLASAADLRGAFNLDFALLLNEASAVFHVPAKCAKKGIQKIVAKLGFVVIGAFEFCDALAEGFNETRSEERRVGKEGRSRWLPY